MACNSDVLTPPSPKLVPKPRTPGLIRRHLLLTYLFLAVGAVVLAAAPQLAVADHVPFDGTEIVLPLVLAPFSVVAIADRAAALDGAVEVASISEAHTRISGQVPDRAREMVS